MCNFCQRWIKRRAVQVVEGEGERDGTDIDHLCPHPKSEYKGDAVPDAALCRIEEMAGTKIRKGDVYRMLCVEGLIDPERIRRAQVNLWMAEKLAKLYVRNADNQLLSSKQLIESSEFQSKGILRWCWHAFMLFVILKTPNDPINRGSQEPRSGKDRVQTGDAETMVPDIDGIRGMKPIFAVTNKDVGQIGGIEGTFPNIYMQMCLWHAQRACGVAHPTIEILPFVHTTLDATHGGT
ncbi:hypothetical protein R1sor_017553 [Riccia sorocarpa]|uniref:Transposase n=1 Tax=Riccia sorocarpa TaxID=122646 RepID=A0ABD3I7J1_9MARC